MVGHFFEITNIVSVKCLVCLGLDILFETFPVLVDVFLLFCLRASRVVWAKVEVSILCTFMNVYYLCTNLHCTFTLITVLYKSIFALAVVRSIRILALRVINTNTWVDLCSTLVDV